MIEENLQIPVTSCYYYEMYLHWLLYAINK